MSNQRRETITGLITGEIDPAQQANIPLTWICEAIEVIINGVLWWDHHVPIVEGWNKRDGPIQLWMFDLDGFTDEEVEKAATLNAEALGRLLCFYHPSEDLWMAWFSRVKKKRRPCSGYMKELIKKMERDNRRIPEKKAWRAALSSGSVEVCKYLLRYFKERNIVIDMQAMDLARAAKRDDSDQMVRWYTEMLCHDSGDITPCLKALAGVPKNGTTVFRDLLTRAMAEEGATEDEILDLWDRAYRKWALSKMRVLAVDWIRVIGTDRVLKDMDRISEFNMLCGGLKDYITHVLIPCGYQPIDYTKEE